MQAKPPWWARISAALEYLHTTAIEIDGQTYALSGQPTRNHLIMLILKETGVVLESHRLDRHHPDPAIRGKAMRHYNGKRWLPFRLLLQFDPQRANELNRWCLMNEPEFRVRKSTTGQWRLEPLTHGRPDFTWRETYPKAS